jgi:hypothetical protein
MSTIIDWSKLTVAQLKDQLRARQLKVSGKKAVLIERLEQHDRIHGQPLAGPPEAALVLPATGVPGPVPKAVSPRKKRAAKDPVKTFKSHVRSADLPLGQALNALFDVYGLRRDEQSSAWLDNLMVSFEAVAQEKPAAPAAPATREGLLKLKVVDLKKILKERGLPVSGKKADLVERILNPPEVVQVTEKVAGVGVVASPLTLPPTMTGTVPMGLPVTDSAPLATSPMSPGLTGTGLPEVQVTEVTKQLEVPAVSLPPVGGGLPVVPPTQLGDQTSAPTTEIPHLGLPSPVLSRVTSPVLSPVTSPVVSPVLSRAASPLPVGLPLTSPVTSPVLSRAVSPVQGVVGLPTLPVVQETGALPTLPTATSPLQGAVGLPVLPTTSPAGVLPTLPTQE